MKVLNHQRYFYIFLGTLILFLDQVSKYFISTKIDLFQKIDYLFINFQLVKNYGAAFNILSGSRVFLSAVSLIFTFILLFLIMRNKPTKRINLYGYGFILGGTLGNGLDRIINGYVIDFINLKFINFPVFNIADLSINIGFFLIIYSLFKEKS